MNHEYMTATSEKLIRQLQKTKCCECGNYVPESLFNMVIFKPDNFPGSALHYCSIKCYTNAKIATNCSNCNETISHKLFPDVWRDRRHEVTVMTSSGGIVIAKACCSVECANTVRNELLSVKSHREFPICKECGRVGIEITEETEEEMKTRIVLLECGPCKKSQEAVRTFYCDVNCQHAHWPIHKKIHKRRESETHVS